MMAAARFRCARCGRELVDGPHVVGSCCRRSVEELDAAWRFVRQLREEARLFARALRNLGIGDR